MMKEDYYLLPYPKTHEHEEFLGTCKEQIQLQGI